MATYFHGGGPDIQTDSLQTLYLMNPAYVGYSDASAAAAAPANMLLFNPAVNPINPMSFAYSPAAAAAAAAAVAGQEPIRSPHPPHTPHPTIGVASHEVSAVHGLVPGRVQYNLWTQPLPPTQQQGLSLSLSSREMSAPAAEAAPNSGGNPKATSAAAQSFLMGSKYLKAAQQLLDEMVNVGKGARAAHDAAAGKGKSEDSDGAAGAGAGSGGGGQEETSAKRAAAAELSTAEKQELQMKKAKLVNMLDEVEQRYRQYHHQMQIVISSFEAVAGHGSARTYTALALQTISKQFRCLRDAITGQIRATSKSLGEENGKTVGSRLRFVDHHLRQQRALQQLGMMQHNAWRPQRGLPERSVSILRAWLFEHFLHPYPKDSDKLMLAKQTGLTRSQVSNWFINARVRLWKPMVEEMYLEETKDREQINNSNNSNNSNSNTEMGGIEDNSTENEPNAAPTARQETDTPKSAQGGSFKEKQSSAMPSYYDDHPSMPTKLKKLRSDEPVHAAMASSSHSIAGVDTKPSEMNNRALLMKFIESSGRSIAEEQGYHSLIAGATSNGGGGGGGGGGGYGGYSIGEIGRFDSQNFAPRYTNNGVSLTLGLPHCENLSVAGGARAHSSFLANEGMAFGRTTIEMGPGDVGEFCSIGNSSQAVNSQQPPNNAYDINIQSRKRFAAQLMPDFVS